VLHSHVLCHCMRCWFTSLHFALTGMMAERGMDAVYRAARITSRSAETPLARGRPLRSPLLSKKPSMSSSFHSTAAWETATSSIHTCLLVSQASSVA